MKKRPLPPTVHPVGRLLESAFASLRRALRAEAFSGLLLLLAAALALFWANSPLAPSYHALWHTPLSIGAGRWAFSQPLHFWINDLLMTLFFLVVGVEIRREIHDGALSKPRQAILPVAAALGGVLAPALIYLALSGEAAPQQGWAIPTATDIAFAVGVLALLGRSIPANVRVFLLALAIIDDLVAVLIIAGFYSSGLDWIGLAVVLVGVLFLWGLQRLGVASALVYALPAALIWLGLWQSGVHPALAGVLLGLMTPVRPTALRAPAVERVQRTLHPWVALGIMPLFALANAGVRIAGVDFSSQGLGWLVVCIAVALVLGKPLGVIGATLLMVRLGWGRLPAGVSWGGVCLIGLLAGVGFTMSIFVAMLAFAEPGALAAAKLGVLLGSLLAAALGLGWGRVYLGRR